MKEDPEVLEPQANSSNPENIVNHQLAEGATEAEGNTTDSYGGLPEGPHEDGDMVSRFVDEQLTEPESEPSYREQLNEYCSDSEAPVDPSTLSGLTADAADLMSVDEYGQFGWDADGLREMYEDRKETLNEKDSDNLNAHRIAEREISMAVGIAATEMSRGLEGDIPVDRVSKHIAGKGYENSKSRRISGFMSETMDWEEEAYNPSESPEDSPLGETVLQNH